MSMRIFFRPAAKAEFYDAAEWYEEQQPSLGDDFVARVMHVLDTIADHPERYPIVCEDVYEALVSRFPYCVYYRVKTDRVIVIAVFHTSRDPGVWKMRI
jgi:plasmid stabilization system protein ParE